MSRKVTETDRHAGTVGKSIRRASETLPQTSAAPGAVAGMQGAKPLAKDNKNLPLPRRGKSALRARVGGMGADGLREVGANRRRQGIATRNIGNLPSPQLTLPKT